MNRIEMFLREGNEKGASDIHLAPGSPVMFRIDGELVPASDEKIKPFEIEEMIEPLLTEEQKAELKEMENWILRILSQAFTGCVLMCSVREVLTR